MSSLLETGELSKPVYNATGDTYTDKRPAQRGTIKGVRQFQTATPKSGLSGTFGEQFRPVARLFEGEEHEPPSKLVARQRAESKKKFISERGFVPSSPAKARTGPGTDEGMFSRTLPLGPKPFPSKAEVPKHPTPAPKNFVTSAPKRGGAGVAGTTIAKYPTGVPDPYGTLRAQQRKELLEERKRMADKKPFVSVCQAAGRYTLDVKEHSSTGVSRVVATDKDKALPPRKLPEDTMTPKEIAEMKAKMHNVEKPFVPSQPAKRGPHATINSFPEAAPEPYDPRLVRRAQTTSRALPDKLRKQKLSTKIAERPTMKPSSGSKTGVTKSIAKMYISPSRLTVGRRR